MCELNYILFRPRNWSPAADIIICVPIYATIYYTMGCDDIKSIFDIDNWMWFVFFYILGETIEAI